MDRFIFLTFHTLVFILIAITSIVEYIFNIIPFIFFGELPLVLSSDVMDYLEEIRDKLR